MTWSKFYVRCFLLDFITINSESQIHIMAGVSGRPEGDWRPGRSTGASGGKLAGSGDAEYTAPVQDTAGGPKEMSKRWRHFIPEPVYADRGFGSV